MREFRVSVFFQYHNPAQDRFPSLLHNLCAFDLILCRPHVTKQILRQFYECLVEGGWLLLAYRGEWEAATARCRDLLSSDGLNPEVHIHAALLLEQMGHPEAAERALRNVLYLDRRFALAHYCLGLLLQRHDARGARRSFENVLGALSRLGAAADCPIPTGSPPSSWRR